LGKRDVYDMKNIDLRVLSLWEDLQEGRSQFPIYKKSDRTGPGQKS
jgi:hypothetical protein